MNNTGHVLLINNKNNNPSIFLIQEKNKHWGIFGGKQEEFDNDSLSHTAVRELHEESLGSLKGHVHLFDYLDCYSFIGKSPSGPTEHQTFIAVNSRIQEEEISVDHPDQDQGFGDIKNGKFFPLYLVLDAAYGGRKTFCYNSEDYQLRYLFAKAIRQNREFLYPLFQRENLNATEARHHLLNVHPVVSSSATVLSSRK